MARLSKENPKPDTSPKPSKSRGEVVTKEMLAQEVLEIEKERIASQDRKTETVRRWIKATDDADKRQHAFSMNRIRNENNRAIDRHNLIRKLIVGGGLFIVFIVLLLLYFIFLGNTEQTENALLFVKYVAIGTAGYGIIHILTAAVKKLFENENE